MLSASILGTEQTNSCLKPADKEGGVTEPTAVEVRAFMGLSTYFRGKKWTNPKIMTVTGELTGCELIAELGLAENMVEVIFVNGKAMQPETAVVRGGDRVALAPPGVPGPYRVLLGFKKMG